MKETIENVSKNKTFKIEESEKIINIVEQILYFNKVDQSGQGLKILTPNQMLSRLLISLGQLKAGNNSEKLTKLGNYCILYTDQKKLTKQFHKSLIDII